ncbi:MAG: alpha/beta fold hydrolase [Isosphaeraceae bacterium]
MRLAAKWQTSWSVVSSGADTERAKSVPLERGRVDVLRLGQGDPIVLVPGLAGSWKLVLPLARQLARDFEVFAIGLRGDRSSWGGDSDACSVSDIGEHADDLARVIELLGLECPTVFGVSFGGAVALEMAVAYPHRLGGLIVHGAEARFRTTLGSTIARQVLDRFSLPTDNRFINQFFHLLYGAKPKPGPLVDFVVDRIWETDQSVMARRLALLETFDVSDRLWRIEVPTLVLAGLRDIIIPASRQRALAQGILGAQFEVIENAGHIGFLTHTTEVVRNVRRHLRKVKAAFQH